jgi:hypothetical protein
MTYHGCTTFAEVGARGGPIVLRGAAEAERWHAVEVSTV